MVFSVSLWVTWRTYSLVYFCQRKLLRKIVVKFQSSVTERCTSLSTRSGMLRQNLFKVPEKKLNLQKSFATHELLHKSFLRFSVRFFYLFTYPPIHKKHVYVLYSTRVLYSYSYLQKVLLPAFTISEMESERKISLSFWIKFVALFDQFFDSVLLVNKSFQLLLIHLLPPSVLLQTQAKWSLSFA